MIRCVRIWTAKDGNSQFEEGTIDLPKGERGDILGDKIVSSSISFRETKSGGTFAPHDAPTRQFVITLSGTLEFKTAKNETFIIRPGDILLAEDEGVLSHHGAQPDGCSDDHNSGTGSAGFGIVPDFRN